MGSSNAEMGRSNNEGPAHLVTISRGFWLTETPVTQSQWTVVYSRNPSRFKGDNRPVERVSWHAAVAYAEKLNTRRFGLHASLPTEAQWEYACRAGTRGAFHVDGSQCQKPNSYEQVLDRLGWFDENSDGETHDVKKKTPNAWGVYDMHGNVREWCIDAMRRYSPDPECDPQGSKDQNEDRVIRGGSAGYQARYCRSAWRSHLGPNLAWISEGFRLSARHIQWGTEPTRPEQPPTPNEEAV